VRTSCTSSGRTELNPFASTAAASTLIFEAWADAGYSGSASSIYGDAGPCDSAGYGIPWLYIAARLKTASSYKLFSSCAFASYWDGNWQSYSGNWSGWVAGTKVSNLGLWNDRIVSVKVIA